MVKIVVIIVKVNQQSCMVIIGISFFFNIWSWTFIHRPLLDYKQCPCLRIWILNPPPITIIITFLILRLLIIIITIIIITSLIIIIISLIITITTKCTLLVVVVIQALQEKTTIRIQFFHMSSWWRWLWSTSQLTNSFIRTYFTDMICDLRTAHKTLLSTDVHEPSHNNELPGGGHWQRKCRWSTKGKEEEKEFQLSLLWLADIKTRTW